MSDNVCGSLIPSFFRSRLLVSFLSCRVIEKLGIRDPPTGNVCPPPSPASYHFLYKIQYHQAVSLSLTCEPDDMNFIEEMEAGEGEWTHAAQQPLQQMEA